MTENGIPETASEWAAFGAEFIDAPFECRWPFIEKCIDEIERLRHQRLNNCDGQDFEVLSSNEKKVFSVFGSPRRL